MSDEEFMEIAIDIMRHAKFPFGAIIVKDGEIIGRSDDDTLTMKGIFTHAELSAIESACKNKNLYGELKGATIYTTCEPCIMCMGAILYEQMGKIVYGATLKDSNDYYSPEMLTDIDALARYATNELEIIGGIKRDEVIEVLKCAINPFL